MSTTAAQLAAIRAKLAITGGDPPVPPAPPASEEVVVVPFAFNTPGQRVFGVVSAGSFFSQAGILVTIPFNAPATIKLGVSADLELLIGAFDSLLTVADDYCLDGLRQFATSDVLLCCLNAAGATSGEGFVYYRLVSR